MTAGETPAPNRRVPRVLVATSNTFTQVTGGGVTLSNLFRGWPADRLANVHEDELPEEHSVCRTFYRLTSHEVDVLTPFNLVWRGRSTAHGRHQRPLTRASHAASDEHRRNSLRAFRTALQTAVREALLGEGVPRTVHISSQFRAWLRAHSPDVVYSFLGSLAQIRLAHALIEELKVPLVIHIMDDWPAVIYRRGLLGPIWRRVILREFDNLLQVARGRLVISDAMSRAYAARYGYPFEPFHNALDLARWLPYSRHSWRFDSGRPFLIRYVGSIVADAQQDAVRDIAAAVVSMADRGTPVEFWLHSPPSQIRALRLPNVACIRTNPPPEDDTVAPLLAGADLLVLPFNFDARSAAYIALSMPTKVPGYMVSATPVLVYGPSNVAAVQYAADWQWGEVLTERGPQSVARALRSLMNDEARREALGTRARRLAIERHDAATVRPAFQRALVEAAGDQFAPPTASFLGGSC